MKRSFLIAMAGALCMVLVACTGSGAGPLATVRSVTDDTAGSSSSSSSSSSTSSAGSSTISTVTTDAPAPRMRPGLDWYMVPDLPARVGLAEGELLALGGLAFGDRGAVLGGVVERSGGGIEPAAWISTSVPSSFAPVSLPVIARGIPEHIANDRETLTAFLLADMSVGDGGYVIEVKGRILTSPDGIEWHVDNTMANAASEVAGTYGAYDLIPLLATDVASGPAGFCLAGGGMLKAPPHDNIKRYACLWTSMDGLDFELPPYSAVLFGQSPYDGASGVTWGPSGWIAVGTRDEGGELVSGAAIWHSVGGPAWEAAHPNDPAPGYGGLYGVAASESLYVAVGSEWPARLADQSETTPLVYTSADGFTWTRRTLGSEDVAGAWLNKVAYGRWGFLALGGVYRDGIQSPAVWLSADGTSWQRVHLWPATERYEGLNVKLLSVSGGKDGYAIVGRRFDEPALWLSGEFDVDWQP